jgi:DNA-binding beta-propeller fold protein YncE
MLTAAAVLAAATGLAGSISPHASASTANPSAATAAQPDGLSDCQTGAAPPEKPLKVKYAYTPVPLVPFGLAWSRHAAYVFASLNPNTGSRSKTYSLGVYSAKGGAPYKPLQQITLPVQGSASAFGTARTRGGRYLLVASGKGAIVIDTAKAVAGSPGAVLGTLSGNGGDSAIEVTLSPNDAYAFVSEEYGNASTNNLGDIEVFNLHQALTSGFSPKNFIGEIVLGRAVVGTAISPDGKTMYATSEITPGGPTEPVDGVTGVGMLSVLDLKTLETVPGDALLRQITNVGCNAVRVTTSPNGKVVWVTARQSNAVLAYDAKKLLTDPLHAQLASVQVGTAPVGMAMIDGGRRLITADSDRFNAAGAYTGLTVVDTAAALAHQQNANLGRIPTGTFPREFALSPAGRALLVSDYGSNEIQTVVTASIP